MKTSLAELFQGTQQLRAQEHIQEKRGNRRMKTGTGMVAAPTWKLPERLSPDNAFVLYLHNRLLWNELLICAIIWMELETITLSERRPVIKDYI